MSLESASFRYSAPSNGVQSLLRTFPCPLIKIPTARKIHGCRLAVTVNWLLCFQQGTVAGWLLGSLMDRWMHTSWISVVGLLLGTAGGLVELIRQVSRDTK